MKILKFRRLYRWIFLPNGGHSRHIVGVPLSRRISASDSGGWRTKDL